MKELDAEVCERVKAHTQFQKLQAEANGSEAQHFKREQRLSLIIAIAQDLPSANDNIEAKRNLDTIINFIEDEFSGVAYDPNNWDRDGRLYPAQEDYRRKTSHPSIYTYRHVAHESHFGTNGAILIEITNGPQKGQVLLDCPGRDNLTVGNLREQPPSAISGSRP